MRVRRLIAYAWTGHRVAAPAMLAVGAVVWLVYAVLWLWLEGPVLDEAAVAAPVIMGEAGYPAGHPNTIVYRRGVTFLYQLGALQWVLHPDPWWISATRNVAFLFVSAFVPFAVVVACTRRPMWGHVAAVLTLSETVCSAVGVYLMWVFPGAYSNGHFGIHLAVLAVVLVAAGMDRAGGLLVGLIPGIHAAMAAVVWPAVAVVLLVRRWRAESIAIVVRSAMVGLVFTGGLAAAVAWRTAGDVASPPYDVRGDGAAIVRTFIRTTDPHRQPLPLPSTIGVVGPIAFATLAALLAIGARRRRVDDRVIEGLVILGVLAWGWALGARAVQAAGGELPLPLAMVMPARFANLAMLLVLPLVVIVLATLVPARTAALVAAGLVVAEGVLLVAARHAGFVQLLPATLGAVLGAVLGSAESGAARRIGGVAIAAVALAVVAVRAPDGSRLAWGFVAAFVPAMVASRLLVRAAETHRSVGAALAVACLAVALLSVRGPHPANAWDFGEERQSAEETALAAWLAAHAPPRTMILAPPFPTLWLQPKTGHPVLVDMNTLLSMTYFPSLAEPVARLAREVFEVDYADPVALAGLLGPDGMLRPSSPVWVRTWGDRSCATWRDIGTRWGFSLVLVPRTLSLRLSAVWSGPIWTLYEIPTETAACSAVGAS